VSSGFAGALKECKVSVCML